MLLKHLLKVLLSSFQVRTLLAKETKPYSVRTVSDVSRAALDPLAFRLLEAACAFTNNMATFDEASIDDGYLDEIREKDCYTV